MDTIVRWTNRIALFVGISLIYWVFIAVSIEVFGFKVFRENMTEAFFLSIFALIALMAGAVIVNVSFNLTRIANVLTQRDVSVASAKKSGWLWIVGLLTLFPLLFGGLYVGDLATSAKREQLILASVQSMVQNHKDIFRNLNPYTFTKEYIEKTAKTLQFLESYDKNFPRIWIIISENLERMKGPVYLSFGSRASFSENEEAKKENYIYSTSAQEREYLDKVFAKTTKDYRFSAHDGFYELYYPVTIDNYTIILYLSDRQDYGKF